jgi:hypothetical protein
VPHRVGALDVSDNALEKLPRRAPPVGRVPPVRRRLTGRRVLYLWISIELAAGIVALAELVFALPSVILLELGRTSLELLLPLLGLSGASAVYLARSALPLVGQVARLGSVIA